MRPLVVVVALFVILSSLPAAAEEPARPPVPGSVRALLEAQGFAIRPEPVRQVFVPYLKADGQPVFVTSDTVLSVYATLLEESFARLEWERARQLPDVLRTLVTGLDGQGLKLELDEDLVERGRRRALRVLAVALGLLGEELPDLDAASRALVEAEVARIERAEGQHLPEWLGPAEAGFLVLDYGRFAPRGPYAQHDLLRRAFRATAWLQAVPFRLDREEEHVAVLLLSQGRGSGTVPRSRRAPNMSARRFLGAYRRLIGRADDLSVSNAGWFDGAPVNAGTLARHRKKLDEPWARALVNDHVAEVPIGLNARILPAARLPDAVLFMHTAAPRPDLPADRLPTGLDLAAALGSVPARAALDAEVLRRLDGAPALAGRERERRGRTTYEDLLYALEALFAASEPEAPALFRSEAWAWKSCQTVLATWALVRRTFVLQAKQTAFYGGGGGSPAGFVEPVPVFYARLRQAAESARERLGALGAFRGDPSRDRLASDLRACAAHVREETAQAWSDKRTWDARAPRLWPTVRLAMRTLQRRGVPRTIEGRKGQGERVAKAFETLAAEVETRDASLDDDIRRWLNAERRDLEKLWRQLVDVCWQLEAMAHKQLRGVDFDEAERRFLRNYGGALGRMHLYGGNSYLTPRDDAMQVADVMSDPFRGVVVHAATGRPHGIVVRYPWQGDVHDCVGAVLTCFEPQASKRLTDATWKELLDGGGAERPAWAAPLFATEPPAGEKR